MDCSLWGHKELDMIEQLTLRHRKNTTRKRHALVAALWRTLRLGSPKAQGREEKNIEIKYCLLFPSIHYQENEKNNHIIF